jgi:hypothetical protein
LLTLSDRSNNQFRITTDYGSPSEGDDDGGGRSTTTTVAGGRGRTSAGRRVGAYGDGRGRVCGRKLLPRATTTTRGRRWREVLSGDGDAAAGLLYRDGDAVRWWRRGAVVGGDRAVEADAGAGRGRGERGRDGGGGEAEEMEILLCPSVGGKRKRPNSPLVPVAVTNRY